MPRGGRRLGRPAERAKLAASKERRWHRHHPRKGAGTSTSRREALAPATSKEGSRGMGAKDDRSVP